MIAPANKVHQLDRVARGHAHIGKGGTWHDFEIALDRELLRVEAEMLGQPGEREPGGNAALLAIDGDDHRGIDFSIHGPRLKRLRAGLQTET